MVDMVGEALTQVKQAPRAGLAERAVGLGGPVADRASKVWDAVIKGGRAALDELIEAPLRAKVGLSVVLAETTNLILAKAAFAEGLSGQVLEQAKDLAQMQDAVILAGALVGGLIGGGIGSVAGKGKSGFALGAVAGAGLAAAARDGMPIIIDTAKRMGG